MIKHYLTFLITLSLTISFGQTYNEKYGQPVIVLIETDPWLMVIGSDTPTFALYENGQIIYRKTIDNSYKYFEINYDSEKTQDLIYSFGITGDLMSLSDYIDSSDRTDQPTNILILNFDILREINVYGNLRDKKSEARDKTPKEYLMVYDNILKFEDKSAKEWIPEAIEVMATNYNHSPEKPLKWNSDWNDINSPTTIKRNDFLYSIYLEKKYFDDFIKLLSKLKQKQAVEINGTKYSLTYRLPFPNIK